MEGDPSYGSFRLVDVLNVPAREDKDPLLGDGGQVEMKLPQSNVPHNIQEVMCNLYVMEESCAAPLVEASDVAKQATNVLRVLPAAVPADGNFLLNMLPVAVNGGEPNDLKFQTFQHKMPSIYQQMAIASASHNSTASYQQCTSYQQCATGGNYSYTWPMPTASIMLNGEIISVNPSASNVVDNSMSMLNTTLCPSHGKQAQHPINMMWNGVGCLQIGESWTPNGFVPLVLQQMPEIVTAAETELTPTQKNILSEVEHMSRSQIPTEHSLPAGGSPTHVPGGSVATKKADAGRNEVKRCDLSTDTLKTGDPSGSIQEIEYILENDMPEVIPMGSLKSNGLFLIGNKIIWLLLNSKSKMSSIPRGVKEDVYFILDDSENFRRQRNGQRRIFQDDFEACSSKNSLKRVHYIYIHGDFEYVEFRKKVFNKCIGGKSTPLQPQPDGDILVLGRYSCFLKHHKMFKKRVTWIETFPNKVIPKQWEIAVTEYVGSRNPQKAIKNQVIVPKKAKRG